MKGFIKIHAIGTEEAPKVDAMEDNPFLVIQTVAEIKAMIDHD